MKSDITEPAAPPAPPAPAATPRVSIDAEAWKAIDALLLELPFRVTAPIVEKLNRGGGVQPDPEAQ